MSNFFTSAEQFEAAFHLEENLNYEDRVLSPKGIGFSIQRQYPKTSKFSPPVKKDGTPDTYALIRIKYDIMQQKNNLVPISANVFLYGRYISKNDDYDFSDINCPTEESIRASKRTPQPISLSCDGDYFYDHNQDTFTNKKGKGILGIDILDSIYNDHIATVDKFKGIILRLKMGSANKGSVLCGFMKDIFIWFLKVTCGRTLAPSDTSRGFWVGYRQEDLKLLKTERINVFGYEASKNIIVTLCVLLLGGYLIFYNTGWSLIWLKTIIKSTLLSFAFVVLAIAILDYILPKIFFYLVNLMIRLNVRLALMRFKL
jgi:hypothetical protein